MLIYPKHRNVKNDRVVQYQIEPCSNYTSGIYLGIGINDTNNKNNIFVSFRYNHILKHDRASSVLEEFCKEMYED
jgi:hypothetical protein